MRIGIFGGSFNPIHTGHAMLANWITQFTDIDRVWLMVSPQNPLKEGYSKMLDMARLRMAEMVSAHCTNVITSGLEFTLPRPSYTINTLDALREKFPGEYGAPGEECVYVAGNVLADNELVQQVKPGQLRKKKGR